MNKLAAHSDRYTFVGKIARTANNDNEKQNLTVTKNYQ